MNIKNTLKTIGCYCLTPSYRRLNRSLLFDRQFYLSGNPDVKEQGVDPLVHYINAGWQEERNPSPLFDSHYYLKENPEVELSGEIPLDHFLSKGVFEDRKPCAWFDSIFYKDTYPQALSEKTSPSEHYYKKGVFDGLYPNQVIKDLPRKPLISIVVPVYNVNVDYLNRCLYSVLFQSYPHWQLCLADDCSSDNLIKETLERWKLLDRRIKVTYLDKNQGISAATNAAAAMATGDFIGFLDNDDELSLQCLFETVKVICTTGADLIYTDEDLINSTSRQTDVFYKPGFNRELLFCHNYITHFVVTDMKLFKRVGGFASKMDGAQDFDLILKLSHIAEKIVHLPKVLYHWRASQTSTSINHSQKEYANEAGRKALMASMEHNPIECQVEFTDWKFYYRCKREPLSAPLVSILFYCGNNELLIIESIKSLIEKTHYSNIESIKSLIEKTHYSNIELIILLSNEDSSIQKIQELSDSITIVIIQPRETIAGLLNRSVDKCHGEYIVFFSNGIVPLSSDWIVALLEYSQDEEIGVVGGRIKPQNNHVQINLTIPDVLNESPIYFADFLQGCSTHMNGLQCSQDVWVTTPLLCMVKKKLFMELQGFKESQFNNLFFIHDLCLRIHTKGLRNIYTPFCEVEKRNFPDCALTERQNVELDLEREDFQKHWQDLLMQGDPFWNRRVLNKKNISANVFIKWYAGNQLMNS